MSDIPVFGGTLDFNGNGIAGCVRCGWRGVPVTRGRLHGRRRDHGDGSYVGHEVIDPVRSTFCPACEPERPERVPRNAPCPCGSGRKAKKCCGVG